jgi:hypothetical protein
MTNSHCRSPVHPPPYISLSQKHTFCPPLRVGPPRLPSSSTQMTFSRLTAQGDRSPVPWPAMAARAPGRSAVASSFSYGGGTGISVHLVLHARMRALLETDMRSLPFDGGARSQTTVAGSGSVPIWDPRFERNSVYAIRRVPFSHCIYECWRKISSISTKNMVANSSRAPPRRISLRRPLGMGSLSDFAKLTDKETGRFC